MFDNPEFIRLARSKLRPARVVLFAAIGGFVCAGLFALMYLGESDWGRHPVANLPGLFRNYFFWVVAIQLFAVSLLGLILSTQNVVLERERSTLDFQRMVGMGPTRLAIGKLLGAPAEAYLIAAVGTAFAGLSVMGGGISMNLFAQSQVCVYVFAILVGSFGLLCSSVVEKTSNASGLGVLISIGYVVVSLMFVRGGTNVLRAADPIVFLMAIYEASEPLRVFRRTAMDFDLFGCSIPNLVGYCVINLLLAWICFAATARRLANDEFSYIGIKQAAIGFGLVQLILVGAIFGGGLAYDGFVAFHLVNGVLLVALAFGLSPSAELFRGRLYRARPNEHWKVLLEVRNRLQDASPIAALLLFTLAYAILSIVVMLAKNHLEPATFAAVVLNSGMAITTACMLVYLHVYMEKGSFKAAIGVLIAALAFPPLLVGIAVSADHIVLVSPCWYLLSLNNLAEPQSLMRFFHGVDGFGAVWCCPAICAALAVLGLILVAMRIRYLLDLNERQRVLEAEQDAKANAALTPGMAAARLMAATPIPVAEAPDEKAAQATLN